MEYWHHRIVQRWRRVGLHIGTLLCAVTGICCLTATQRSLSGTFDESNHLAAGLEWWQFRTYTLWTENPPLARAAIAALPFLHGMRLPDRSTWEPKTHEWDRSWEVGTDLLYAGEGFETNLRRARMGVLPFFLITLASVWGLADGRRRPAAGLIAVALTSTTPAFIAHGALATTDVPFAGMFLLATLALSRWFALPTNVRAGAVGVAAGLAVLTKFSTLVFLPLCVVAMIGARSPPRRPLPWASFARQAGLAAFIAAMVTWAGYGFSIGRIDDLAAEVKGWLPIVPTPESRGVLTAFLFQVPLPLAEFFHGLLFLAAHDRVGHDAYLLGKVSDHGFTAFYPIALLVKTPLPFLALFGATLIVSLWRPLGFWPTSPAIRRRARTAAHTAALTALLLLLVSLRSRVNLGIRHVFVLLPLLAVVVDDRLIAWRGVKRWMAVGTVALCLVLQTGSAVATVPNGLGYFNALAGRDPAAVLLDSDLDWGQDLFQLRREVRARRIDLLNVAFFGTLRLCRHGLPTLRGLAPARPTRGWIAVSENYYRHRSSFMLLKDPCDPKSTYRDGEVPDAPFAWLHNYQPVVIAGSSIRLYHIP